MRPHGTNPASAQRYEQLSRRGGERTRRGDFPAALAAYDEARDVAVRLEDPRKIDGADLNRAMVLIQMGQARRGEDGLREILLRTDDRRVGFTAAYNLAASLRRQGRYERAMSYASRALDQCRELGATDLVAAALNLRGNILLNQNYLDEAMCAYREALALRESSTGDHRYSIAILEENIGYCLLLQEHLIEGLEHIHRALELAEAVEDRRCRTECLQDLCYGHLLLEQFDAATLRGEQALAEAIDAGYSDIEENCHYLLGEIGSRTGEIKRRDRHFGLLQASHPELPFLKDFLCSVDVTSIITLKR